MGNFKSLQNAHSMPDAWNSSHGSPHQYSRQVYFEIRAPSCNFLRTCKNRNWNCISIGVGSTFIVGTCEYCLT